MTLRGIKYRAINNRPYTRIVILLTFIRILLIHAIPSHALLDLPLSQSSSDVSIGFAHLVHLSDADGLAFFQEYGTRTHIMYGIYIV